MGRALDNIGHYALDTVQGQWPADRRMKMPKSEKPFNKIIAVRTKLGLYIEYGDHALDGQTPQRFAEDVRECFEYLMDFRNIINSMVSFNEPPTRAVIPYLSNDDIEATREKV